MWTCWYISEVQQIQLPDGKSPTVQGYAGGSGGPVGGGGGGGASGWYSRSRRSWRTLVVMEYQIPSGWLRYILCWWLAMARVLVMEETVGVVKETQEAPDGTANTGGGGGGGYPHTTSQLRWFWNCCGKI